MDKLSPYNGNMNYDNTHKGRGDVRMPFGQALKYRREKLGYTQYDVGAAIGVSPSSVSKLEARQFPTRNRHIIKQLAGYLQGTEQELIAGLVPAAFPLKYAPVANGDGHDDYLDTAPAPVDGGFVGGGDGGAMAFAPSAVDGVVWDMENPTDIEARMKVAWRDYRRIVALIAERTPEDLWGAVNIVLAATREASGLSGKGTLKGPRKKEGTE